MLSLLRRLRSEKAFLLLILAASVSINVALAQSVSLAQFRPPRPASQAYLLTGTYAPKLAVQTVEGQPIEIDFNVGIPTVLYVMSPLCNWCKRNMPGIRTLEAQTRGRYRIIGLAMDSEELSTFVSEQGTSFPVYVLPEATKRAYHLITIPETFVVSPSGLVLRSWGGWYRSPFREEIDDFLGVLLPESPSPAADSSKLGR